MATIRDFIDYADAKLAVRQAGGVFITDSNQGQDSGRSFAPDVHYRLPDGQKVAVLWNGDRGYVKYLSSDY